MRNLIVFILWTLFVYGAGYIYGKAK